MMIPDYPIEENVARATEHSFTYHAPMEHQIPRYEKIRQDGKALAVRILRACPPSRERSLAMTNLEQAVMWANAAIARNE